MANEIEVKARVRDKDLLMKKLAEHGCVLSDPIGSNGNNEEYEVCLDEVTDLGTFIELEKMAEDHEDGPTVQEALFKVMTQKLGVLPEDKTLQGYDTMMENKG